MAKMIISRLFGGLGNQLFIYAASRSFAYRYNAQLYLDTVSGFKQDTLFQRHFALGNFTTSFAHASRAQRLEPFSKTRRRCARIISRYLHSNLLGYVYDNSLEFRPELLQLPNRRTVHLEGYWQSPNYFSEVALRDDLKIIPPHDKPNLEFAQKINSSPSTSVHMRFFDQGNHKQSQLKEQYYYEATAVLKERRGNSHFYIFSDDPVRAEQVSRRVWKDDFTIVSINRLENQAYADMWLMSLCENNIIADSTFSWWAAWFNRTPERIILAPRRSLSGRDSAWKPRSLIPNDWILV